MEKAANIYVRVKPEIKAQAEQVFDGFGITVSEAVNIFLHKAIMVGGIPFEIRPSAPNAETLEAMREVERMERDPSIGKGYTDVKQMLEELLV
jgi:DNA-damage-inducible protein J